MNASINGRDYTFEPGETILQVARRNGMEVRGGMVKHYYGMEMPHIIFSICRTDREKEKCCSGADSAFA